MNKLLRAYPFGDLQAPVSISADSVKLSEERGIGFARLTARDMSRANTDSILNIIGISRAPLANEVVDEGLQLAGLSRREWLLIGEEDEIDKAVSDLNRTDDLDVLVVNSTHQLAPIKIGGPLCREVLSTLTMFEFSDNNLPIGGCLRTPFEETAVWVHRTGGEYEFRLVFDQSYSAYALRLLEHAIANAAA